MVLISRVSNSLRRFYQGDNRSAMALFSSCTKNETSSAKDPACEIIFEKINNKGVITLNKPRVLNSINLPMVSSIVSHLEDWENEVDMVIIQGAGSKAFCAGGDIVSATKGGPKDCADAKRFFRVEYLMNNIIGTYRKPYIALIDGITMGGGVGLSVHGKYRVATEKTLFAMPETAIGLFPDVGGGYFLPRLKGKLGYFLALTGYRLKGVDTVGAGIATHYCKSDQIPELLKALLDGDVKNLESTLAKLCPSVASCPFTLDSKMGIIDSAFSQPTVESILEELEREGSTFSTETVEAMSKMSPTSLKITKHQLDLGSQLNLQQVLQMENRLAASAVEGKISLDFYEGVRALLIDKDKNPVWNPACLKDVTPEMVEKAFERLDELEELIPQ